MAKDKAKAEPKVANMGAGADEQNAAKAPENGGDVKAAEPAEAAPEAKPAKKAAKKPDGERIDLIVQAMTANGWSLPKGLE